MDSHPHLQFFPDILLVLSIIVDFSQVMVIFIQPYSSYIIRVQSHLFTLLTVMHDSDRIHSSYKTYEIFNLIKFIFQNEAKDILHITIRKTYIILSTLSSHFYKQQHTAKLVVQFYLLVQSSQLHPLEKGNTPWNSQQ